jgi:hypothetical protein
VSTIWGPEHNVERASGLGFRYTSGPLMNPGSVAEGTLDGVSSRPESKWIEEHCTAGLRLAR